MKHFLIAISCCFFINQMLLAETNVDFQKSYKTDTLTDGTTVYLNPDTMASFPGGTKEMIKFIYQNLKYPPLECFEEKVIFKMVIRENGEITNVVVMRPIHEWLDKEAMRVVRLMPDFIPAKVQGKNVASYYIMPVRFTLRGQMDSE